MHLSTTIVLSRRAGRCAFDIHTRVSGRVVEAGQYLVVLDPGLALETTAEREQAKAALAAAYLVAHPYVLEAA